MLISHPSRLSDEALGSETARKHNDYFRRLFDEAPAACVVTDFECNVIDANQAAETMLRRPLAGMRDKPFQLMIAVSDRPNFRKIVSDLLKSVFESSRP